MTEKSIEKKEEKQTDTDIETETELKDEHDLSVIVQEKEKEIEKLYSQLLRLKADFENYRRRTEKEKEKKFIIGKESVLIKLINLIDIFDTAIDSTKNTDNVKDIVDGIHLLKKEFDTFLNKEGVKVLETIGKKFDHTYHEIVGTEENNEFEDDTILKEVQKGYLYNDRDVIRTTKVIVSRKPKNESQN